MPAPMHVAEVLWSDTGAVSYRLHDASNRWRAARGIGRLVLPRGDVIRHVDGLLDGGDDDAPAVDVGEACREWWRRGVRHRDGDRPAMRTQQPGKDGESLVVDERYYRRGVLHRDGDQPAISITQHRLGTAAVARHLAWFVDGKSHRDGDRPALILRASDGALKRIAFCRDGLTHRDASPSGKRRAAVVNPRENLGMFFRFGQWQSTFPPPLQP